MNAPVTRRALLGATAAVGAMALPAIAEAAIPVSDVDAELRVLLDRFDAAREAWDATDDPLEAASTRAVAAYPPLPNALRWRPDDMAKTSLGRGLSDPEGPNGGRVYGGRAADWLRDRPAATWFPSLALSPACEIRRVAILRTWDAHVAAMEAVNDAVGLTVAAEAEDEAQAAWNDADDAVKLYQPRTLAGLARKATWVAMRLQQGCDDDLGEVFARQVAAFGGVTP